MKTDIRLYFLITCILFNSRVTYAQEKEKLLESVFLNVGITCYKNQYKNKSLNNYHPTVCKAFNVGLEFYNKKHDVSIDLRKTIWIGLTASSRTTDVSATANYNQIGATKYFNVNPIRRIGLNVSHIWASEFDEVFIKGNNYYIGFFSTPYIWTSKSISLAGSINLTTHLFTELKFNYYYHIGGFYGRNGLTIPKKGINDNRIQISLIYKINREDKK